MGSIYHAVIVLLLLASNILAQQKGMRALVKGTGENVGVYTHSWALIIGINKYREWPRLDYAVNDARSVREMLINKYAFPPANIIILTDEKATLQNIKNGISSIAERVGNNDRVLIYFSGHGQTLDLKDGGQMGFLIPVEGGTKDNELYSTCLPMTDLKTQSTLIPAKHILFLVDACYSGLAASMQRGLPHETKLYLIQITAAKGRQIITAGSKGEQSEENPEWGHGAFTYKLLEGLDKGLADQDGDGIITATELADYLKSRVAQISHHKQTPQFRYLTDDEGEFVFVMGSSPEPEAPSLSEGLPAEFKVPASTDDMVLIEGGSFEMGSNNGNLDEEPVHRAYVDNFYMDKYEVTQKHWKNIMGNNPSRLPNCDECPVDNVSWEDVQQYLQKLNESTGEHYRLPTEAEWEYAAHGGNKSLRYTYSGSNNMDEVAWYSSNASAHTHPVGQKKPNELGIYDMSGNVSEWCSDRYDKGYYSNSPVPNPQGPNNNVARVLRGGSWGNGSGYCRVSSRDDGPPTYRNGICGFRLAKDSK